MKRILLFFLILSGFFYRVWGLGADYSFWTDEQQTAIFSRAILEKGKPRTFSLSGLRQLAFQADFTEVKIGHIVSHLQVQFIKNQKLNSFLRKIEAFRPFGGFAYVIAQKR